LAFGLVILPTIGFWGCNQTAPVDALKMLAGVILGCASPLFATAYLFSNASQRDQELRGKERFDELPDIGATCPKCGYISGLPACPGCTRRQQTFVLWCLIVAAPALSYVLLFMNYSLSRRITTEPLDYVLLGLLGGFPAAGFAGWLALWSTAPMRPSAQDPGSEYLGDGECPVCKKPNRNGLCRACASKRHRKVVIWIAGIVPVAGVALLILSRSGTNPESNALASLYGKNLLIGSAAVCSFYMCWVLAWHRSSYDKAPQHPAV
jgi:hypothetical protein